MVFSSSLVNQEFSHIDRYYRRFVNNLMPEIREIAYDVRTYYGPATYSKRKFTSLNEITDGFSLLPFLFQEEFKLGTQQMRTISLGTTFGCLYGFIEDKIIDEQLTCTPEIIFLYNSLFFECLMQFRKLFSENSDFWSHWQRYFSEYRRAVIKERKQIKLGYYNHKEFYMIAKGKAALDKISCMAVAFLANRNDTFNALARTSDCFGIALQLADDVKDWEEDYLAQRYSFLLLNVLSNENFDLKRGSVPSIEEMKIIIHSGYWIERTLEESNKWLRNAMKAVRKIKCDAWLNYLKSCIKHNKSMTEALVKKKIELLLKYTN